MLIHYRYWFLLACGFDKKVQKIIKLLTSNELTTSGNVADDMIDEDSQFFGFNPGISCHVCLSEQHNQLSGPCYPQP